MPKDSSGYMRPGSDPRDDDLDDRERRAIANENSGTETRRAEVVSGRARRLPTRRGGGWGKGGHGI